MRSPSDTGDPYPTWTPRESQTASLSVSVPVFTAGTAAIMPIALDAMFSSLWVTSTLGPTISAAVLSPR